MRSLPIRQVAFLLKRSPESTYHMLSNKSHRVFKRKYMRKVKNRWRVTPKGVKILVGNTLYNKTQSYIGLINFAMRRIHNIRKYYWGSLNENTENMKELDADYDDTVYKLKKEIREANSFTWYWHNRYVKLNPKISNSNLIPKGGPSVRQILELRNREKRGE